MGERQRNPLQSSVTAYLNVWNMDCPDCVHILHDGLIELYGMDKVDVFYKQGIVVTIYDPDLVEANDVLDAIRTLGRRTAHFYGAEVIGYGSADQTRQM